MSNDYAYEAFVLYEAYKLIHEQLLSTNPLTADTRDLVGPLAHYGHRRAACLLHAQYVGTTLRHSYQLVADINAMLHQGQRPRCLAELGLTADDLQDHRT
jgi:hypothetical protein